MIGLSTFNKERDYLKKDLKKWQKCRTFHKIAEMYHQSRDELERVAKIRRIKNYDEMTKEELIISL